MGESEAWVGRFEAWNRAAFVRVKEALGSGYGGHPDHHYPFKDLNIWFLPGL